MPDNARRVRAAVPFFGIDGGRDPQAQAARLLDQFIRRNLPVLNLLNVTITRDYDGKDVLIVVQSGNAVGAVPLMSPLTARDDFGLVVQPRFPWAGIGPTLAEMGWLISPTPLRLPLLKRSERRVPPWVLSLMILVRIKLLLDKLDRRFEIVAEETSSPKGAVQWGKYATRHMAFGKFLSVPCVYPDLRDDRRLKGAIRFTLEKQLQSLETQSGQGSFVHRLISFAEFLLLRVQGCSSLRPNSLELDGWIRRPLRSDPFLEGLQAIEWTVEERGLAGTSDLGGIPWTMPMEQFFEAWVETVFKRVARSIGGVLKTGRKRETVSPIHWESQQTSSLNSLIPDLMMICEDFTVILDAKYKRHWEELGEERWIEERSSFREQHRHDLHQVLAYANLAQTKSVVACLVYPCSTVSWESMLRRKRLFQRGRLSTPEREVHLWLTALPIGGNGEHIAAPITNELRSTLRADTA